MAKTCPFCAEKIQNAAKVCRHCGREVPASASPGLLKRPIGCGGALLLLVGVGFCVSLIDAPSRPTPPAPATTQPADESITLAKFRQLQDGMSYAQAVEILGREGVEQSRSNLAGTVTVMYQWANPGIMAGNMNAMFQNDRLITKAQFGLK